MLRAVSILGWSAAVLSILVPLPQVYTSVVSHKFEGLNIITHVLATLCQVLWIVYAAMLHLPTVYVCSAISCVYHFAIIVAFIRHKQTAKTVDNQYRNLPAYYDESAVPKSQSEKPLTPKLPELRL
jgi:uncharacterized protein with PQ loop repeat